MTAVARTEGEKLRDEGLAKVAENGAEFLEVMRERARILIRQNGECSTDDLRHFAKQIRYEPHHQNVWGGVFRGAEWERIREVRSKWPSNHGRPIGVYRLAQGFVERAPKPPVASPPASTATTTNAGRKNGMETVRRAARETAKRGGGERACPYPKNPHLTVWLKAYFNVAQFPLDLRS